MRWTTIKTISLLLFLILSNSSAFAEFKTEETKLNIYNINTLLLNEFNVIKKGTALDVDLLNEVFTGKDKNNSPIDFQINNENLNLKASGFITMLREGERFSRFSSLELSTNKLFLDDGQEVHFSASSLPLQGIHPPHADDSYLGLARIITNLSLASSPATLGISLGASFLANGLLSAHKNGISDFFWGGFNGSGLSFIERLFRKQPEIYLANGTSIPFVLTEDLKISRGIKKDKIKYLNISKEEALSKIQDLLERGDLTGALELSIKTGQKDLYDELIKKISS